MTFGDFNIMLKLSNKIAYIIIGIVLAIAGGVVYAAGISVPQATTKGDLPCGASPVTGNYTLLHPGSDGLVLTASSTAPCGLTYQTASSTGAVIPSNGIPGQFLGNTATGTLAWLRPLYITVCSSGCDYTATGTNDQVGINAAITAANTAGGGTVLIKAGTYSLPTTGQVNLKSNVNLIGEGAGTLINVAVTDASSSQRAGIQASSTSNSSIRNLRLNGGSQSSVSFNSDILVEISSSTNISISNNIFENSNGFAIFISPNNVTHVGSTSGVTIMNNFMSCNGKQDCIGGGPHEDDGRSSVEDINIIGNTITQNTFAGGVLNSNMDTNCMDLVRVYRLTFQGNICKGHVVFGNERVPNSYSNIENNIIDAPLGPVVSSGDIAVETGTVTSDATNTPTTYIISGNTIKSGGIYIPGSGTNPTTNLVISNNTIQTSTSTAQTFRSAQHGIQLSDTINSIITGNTITSFSNGAAGTKGIVFGGSSSNNSTGLNTIKGFATGIDFGPSSGNKSQLNTFISNTTNHANGDNVLFMTSAGNVGVGSTTAPTKLFVQQDQNAATDIRIENNSTSSSASARIVSEVGLNNAGIIQFAFPVGGTTIAEFAGDAGFYTQTGTGNLDVASRSASGALRFYTGGSASTNRRMTIDSTGNVGIGLTPNFKLEVAGTASTTALNVVGNINNATLTASSLVKTDANKNLQSVILGNNLSLSGNTLNALSTTSIQNLITGDGNNISVTGGVVSITDSPTFSGNTTLNNINAYSGSVSFNSGIILGGNLNAAGYQITNGNWTGTPIPQLYGGTGTNNVPTVQGQIPIANSNNGLAYEPGTLVAGSNMTIDTSTPGQITLSSTGGGSGNSAFTIGSGKIYNATSTDLVGIGTTAPTTTLYVQGKAGTNPFVVASSTGSLLLSVLQSGTVAVGSASQLTINSSGDISAHSGNLVTGNGSVSSGGNQTLQLLGSFTTNQGFQITQAGTAASTQSAGTNGNTTVNGTYSPTSGTGIYTTLNVNGTIKQTGNANGITRSILITPVITQAYDYRALETAGFTEQLDASTTPATTVYNVLFNPITYNNTSTTKVSLVNASTLSLSNPIVSNQTTIASSAAISITSSTLNASTTLAYGLFDQAPTGAGSNYAAVFMGGNVGIGTTVPAQALDVNGTIQQSNQKSCLTGLTTDANGAINGCVTSDESLKTGIVDLSYSPILDKIMPRHYSWKPAENKDTKQHDGFVAQEVQQVLPECVVSAGEGILGVDANCMTANLWLQVQHLGKGSVDTAKENWQWIFIGLLILGFISQQIQINKLKK